MQTDHGQCCAAAHQSLENVPRHDCWSHFVRADMPNVYEQECWCCCWSLDLHLSVTGHRFQVSLLKMHVFHISRQLFGCYLASWADLTRATLQAVVINSFGMSLYMACFRLAALWYGWYNRRTGFVCSWTKCVLASFYSSRCYFWCS